MPPLRALLLSDGRPGHVNLSLGLLAAAGRLRTIETHRIEVTRGRWPGAMVAAWSNSGRGPARLLQTVYGLEAGALPAVDLVVSAGAETLAANVACARLGGAANIFYGSLRAFRPEAFDLVLTSYQAAASKPRHALSLKPSPAAEASWLPHKIERAKPPRRLALLVGGPSGECGYDTADWDRLHALVERCSSELGVHWLITTSRRTPAEAVKKLNTLASGTASLVDGSDPASMPLSALLAASDAALVTDDSSSMVSDAVAAGLPTLGLRPERQRLTTNEQDYRQFLERNGWYRSIPSAGLEPAGLMQNLAILTPRSTDPSQELADLLQGRLPDVFPKPAHALGVADAPITTGN